jgi:hypothetical protein
MEKQLKAAGKNDVEIKEFGNKISAVLGKYLNQELAGIENTPHGKKMKNTLIETYQLSMMNALISQ